MNLPKLSCKKLIPNLVVSNVDASLRFYEEVLGFDRSMTFPEQSPFIFATVTSGSVQIFLSDRSTVIKEDLRLSDLTLGGGNIMLIEVDGVDTMHARIAPLVEVVMSLRTQWFGMREFKCSLGSPLRNVNFVDEERAPRRPPSRDSHAPSPKPMNDTFQPAVIGSSTGLVGLSALP